MKNWLLKPFPFVNSSREALSMSIFTGVFVTLFLYVFKPFGIDTIDSPLIYLSGYGLISFWSVFFSLQIMPALLPSWFDRSEWTISKNILHMVWILLLISFFNWLYGMFLHDILNSEESIANYTMGGMIESLGMTVSVGVFPILILNYFLERRFLAKNVKLAKEVAETMVDSSASMLDRTPIEIPIDGNKVQIISSDNLLCVKSEGGNYVTIYWKDEGETKSQLWRITLKTLLTKIKVDQDILQCHKSYLVNRSFIAEVTGNARTLILKMEGVDFEIPVSRNFPRELIEHYHLQQA